LLISFAGVVVISLQNESNSGLQTDPLGIFLALASSIAWAAYWLLQFKSRLDKSLQLFLNFSISFVMLLIISAATGQTIPQGSDAWLPAVWTGVFEMGITFFLWMSAMQYAEKTHIVSNLAFLSPFVSLFFINLVLDESISEYTIIGLTLIIAGILIQKYLSRKPA
ncbi:MAG TPA: DMT family transporter, partial [Bacteroidales bacterium]|nr:DMT family transporter [Bacteroidales bacterium]